MSLCCIVIYIYSYCCITTFGDKGSSIMAHMAFGHIQEFDPNVEGISSYLEWVGLYFVANKIESERQVAVFQSLVVKITCHCMTCCCRSSQRINRLTN